MTGKVKSKRPTAAAAAELQAVQRIIERQAGGATLTRGEVVRLERYERQRRDEVLVDALTAVPQHIILSLFGIAPKTLRAWEIEQGMPRNPGRPATYDLKAVCLWKQAQLEAARRGKVLAGGDPLMLDLGGARSPALERYRAARASLAELELGQKSGDLIFAEDSLELLSQFMGPLCRFVERLQAYGIPPKAIDEWADLVNSTISRWTEVQIEKHKNEDGKGAGGGSENIRGAGR